MPASGVPPLRNAPIYSVFRIVGREPTDDGTFICSRKGKRTREGKRRAKIARDINVDVLSAVLIVGARFIDLLRNRCRFVRDECARPRISFNQRVHLAGSLSAVCDNIRESVLIVILTAWYTCNFSYFFYNEWFKSYHW